MSWEVNTAIGVFLVAVILYSRSGRGKCTSKRRMNGKVVIITGCTSGIGRETARDLAARGARVIMACRNSMKANMTRDEIISETGNSQVDVRELDLGSMQSVRNFCSQINRTEKRIDILIHNAGTAEVYKKYKSPDGFELTMATNQYGPFLMTHLLIDLLKKSTPCRIVIVASSFYYFACHSLENGGNHVDGLPWSLYYLSKYANIQFSMELAKRLQGTGITVNCLHPGHIETGIWKSCPFPLSIGLYIMMKLIFKNVIEGAQTTLHLAVSEELEGVTGKYFSDCRAVKLQRSSVQNPVKCKKFWEISEKLLLKPEDPRIK